MWREGLTQNAAENGEGINRGENRDIETEGRQRGLDPRVVSVRRKELRKRKMSLCKGLCEERLKSARGRVTVNHVDCC